MAAFHNHLITTAEQPEAVFPGRRLPTRSGDRHINGSYQALIEAAPFSRWRRTAGGLDCSPRGDPPVSCASPTKTLLIPDRRSNNRIDSFRNIVRDPRVALMFMIPGCGE
jgi:predicted pyridoxine 5'-phosphate oxidase superfamily flavin-nucleotide-binding protein